MRPATELTEFCWLWAERAGQTMPRVHRRILNWLADRVDAGDRRLLLMAFRGAGKSTLVGLFCAWWLRRDPDARILVLAADLPLAVRMVSNVRSILERHPLCEGLRPPAGEPWAMDRLTIVRPAVLRDPSLLAAGIFGNITGARADLIICDDVEVAGNCDTEQKREALRERLAETEFVLTPSGTILYVGTPHTQATLYDTGDFLRGYRALRVKLLDAAGLSAWPERFGPAHVAALRERVGPRAFARQMQLEAVDAAPVRLDPAALVRYAEEPEYREAGARPVLSLLGRRLVSGGGFWDPAYGRPGSGDASVLACTYADAEGNHYLHRIAYLHHDPDAAADPATQQCVAVAGIARELLLPVVRVETNGIGRFLPAMLRAEMARAGAACTVLEHASTRAKEDRILGAIEPVLMARRLYAHEAVLRGRFATEMREWRPDRAAGRDDGLDALAGCLMSEPVRFPGAVAPPRGPGWRG